MILQALALLGENPIPCTPLDPEGAHAQMLQDLMSVAPQRAVNTWIVRHPEYCVEVRDDGNVLQGESLLF